MKVSIGFAIVTYNRPLQTLRLCERLNCLFENAPICIHHDFSQCDIDPAKFPGNVHFVRDWKRTKWASITVVDGLLSAIRLLHERFDPQWFTHLSTFDYPVQPGEQVLYDLRQSKFDLYMDMRPAKDLGQSYVNAGLGTLAFEHPRFQQVAFNRYVAKQLVSQRVARKFKQAPEAWVLKHKFIIDRTTPFKDGLQCFAGDYWFTGNRKIASILLDENAQWKKLHKHFEGRPAPEESFFHTLLGNAPGLRISNDNLRYTDWTGCYAHPRVLGRDDFQALLRTSKHFARKFPDDPKLMAELDTLIENKQGVLTESAA